MPDFNQVMSNAVELLDARRKMLVDAIATYNEDHVENGIQASGDTLEEVLICCEDLSKAKEIVDWLREQI